MGRNDHLRATDTEKECHLEQVVLTEGHTGAMKGYEGIKVLNERSNSPLESTDQGVCPINPDAWILKIVIRDEMTKESVSHSPEAAEEEASTINPNARGSKCALMDKIIFLKVDRYFAAVPGRENQGVGTVESQKAAKAALV